MDHYRRITALIWKLPTIQFQQKESENAFKYTLSPDVCICTGDEKIHLWGNTLLCTFMVGIVEGARFFYNAKSSYEVA